MLFSEHDQDRDTRKEQALYMYITNLQSDWFIPQNERFLLATKTRNGHHKNSESSKANVELNVYSREDNFDCWVTANIQAELSSFTAKHTYLQWYSQGRFEKKKNFVTHWGEQRGVDSYLQRQISQSDREISSNCGK